MIPDVNEQLNEFGVVDGRGEGWMKHGQDEGKGVMKEMTEDLRAGGLIWATDGGCPSNDDKRIEDDTKRGDAKDN